MQKIKLSTETKSWMRYLSPTARSMLFALPMLVGQNMAFANETVVEKAQSGMEEGVKDVKQEYRNRQNKSCDPKMEKHCTLKKMKNKAKNAKDEVTQKAKETKRKVD
ncbi:MAG: hypothetical protein ABIR96_10465 [Bdellovibrionota bacterium]